MTSVLEERILIGPAGTIERAAVGDGFTPTRIGFLSDMPAGKALGEYLDPIILAIEDALAEGRMRRPVELLASHVVGLPTGQPNNVIAAYLDLVERGCVLVLSTGVTDNALVLRDTINAAKVPLITMAGTTRFVGDYCFSLANGGHGEEAAIMASYLADHGLRRVVLTGERSPGDSEYHRFFQEQARLYGIDILTEHYFDQEPTADEVDTVLRHFRDDLRPDALVYCGFGWNSSQFNPALTRIGWHPPKIMNAAIMWALTSPEWKVALDGWIGIEQSIGDHEDLPKNLNWVALLDRHEKRFGYRRNDTMIALLYDQGRAAVEAVVNAPILTGEGMAAGLERIKMIPSTLGGPRTYIEFGERDHRGYKGDFMFMKQLRDGEFHFAGFHSPQWAVNRTAEAAG
ncbi:ABC transporter substrate-binding protein [Frankia gtarii]|uniref:ABC transporter substrate-binding protein n=1 Tax=Frankia gtarii TaxID=2950102 RepID=UPI0021BEB035|nr:ABC transporter substrate-binding protein [Frankia gtarii]